MRGPTLAAVVCASFFFSAGAAEAAEPQVLQVQLQSTLLSRFLKQPVGFNASVLLPDDYYKATTRRYPVVYVFPGFDGPSTIDESTELPWQRPMRALGAQFIVVILDGMIEVDSEDLHQQFADSANDGPWGTALVQEFIPATNAHFRTLGTSQTTFLFGHSSGGWSALWLQVNYPDAFNGVWAVAPDPVDFHAFLGPDLTNPAQNFYRDGLGNMYTICRRYGHDMTTLRALVSGSLVCYAVLPPPGRKPWGVRQIDTYDEVFSPKRLDGTPAPLFDRTTGVIDSAVADYWEEHYDITRVLEKRWSVLAPKLRGKLHVFVGAEDTFHLEGSVNLMKAALTRLDSDAEFGIMPGADHWQIFDYHGGLIRYAIGEMTLRLTADPSLSRYVTK
jgi:pimeloyl-ACP methyl ester carboxylesterase